MSFYLNKDKEPVPEIKIAIAKADFQMEYLKAALDRQKEEAQAIENQITILKAKHQGLKGIMMTIQEEFEKSVALYFKLHKENEKGTEPIATTQCKSLKVE